MWSLRKLKKQLKAVSPKPRKRNLRSSKLYSAHKETAREIIFSRLEYYAPLCEVKYKRVAIRDQSRRWGSCSSLGNLNFNFRLALIPAHLCDYVVVHELCHLKQMNHSPAFWAEVAKILPNYQELVAELRVLERSGTKNQVASDSYLQRML